MNDLKISESFRALGFIVPDNEPSLDLFRACGCLIDHDHALEANVNLMKLFRILQQQGVKVETPSIIELQLASRLHRWKDLQKLQKDFFRALEDKVWEYERDALKLLGLPTIDQLQRDAAGEDISSEVGDKPFELTPTKRRGYLRIMKEWMLDLIGRDKMLSEQEIADLQKSAFYHKLEVDSDAILLDTYFYYQQKFDAADTTADFTIAVKQLIGGEVMPIYDFNMLSGFSIGQRNTWKQILDTYRDTLRQQGLSDQQIEARVRELLKREIIPQASNRHLAYFMNTGKNRIQARISEKIYAEVLKVLQQMAREGKSPLEVGRYLHNQYGGQLWQWLRIARSEPVLAYNAAFDEQSKAAGAQYEEWNCASGACDICSAFDGRIWRLQEGPQPCQDSHPHCFKPLIRVYTISGWKKIKDIEINDLVLTHNGRFRRVVKTHKYKKKSQKIISLSYYNDMMSNILNKATLELTDNHPVLINGHWKDAGEIKVGDKVRLLATRCKQCNKKIVHTRWDNRGENIKRESSFCSISCSAKYNKNKLWVFKPYNETEQIRKKISAKAKMQVCKSETREILSKRTTSNWKDDNYRRNVSGKIRLFHKNNPNYSKQKKQEFIIKNKARHEEIMNTMNKKSSEFWRDKERSKNARRASSISISNYYKERPGYAREIQIKWRNENPEKANKIDKESSSRAKKRLKDRGNLLLKGCLEWREKHPDKFAESINKSRKTLTKNNYISQPQQRLYELIKQYYPSAELEYFIKTNVGCRFGDIVLTDKRIIVEYDGSYWHHDKDKDLQRDIELQFAGWTVLHFNETNWEKAPQQVARLLKNHNNEYEFVDIEICNVESKIEENITLYNLSVDEDESYVAKGFVVHNCLCIRLARFTMPVDKPLQQAWNRPSPYEQAYKPEEIAGLLDFLRNNIFGIPRPGLI